MKIEKGKLVLQGKKIMLELPTKKGAARFSIPEAAKRFRDADFSEGIEATVHLDEANRIVFVAIPGKTEVAPKAAPPAKDFKKQGGANPPRSRNYSNSDSGSQSATAVQGIAKASPKVIGEPFHNPYTFIPFASKPVRERRVPTVLTIDETPEGFISHPYTGVLQLRVETISPLLTSNPIAVNAAEKGKHQAYRALTIDDDVVVPATGVRGSMRTLLTILCSGTLGYLDQTAFLVQGRDMSLGPSIRNDLSKPTRVDLGLVIRAGSVTRPGRIQLGETRLVKLRDIERLVRNSTEQLALDRRPGAQPLWIQLDAQGKPVTVSKSRSDNTPWRLRLSGPVVGGRRMEERKTEAVFLAGGLEFEIPPTLWSDYSGRNAFGVRPMLQDQDLVWLSPKRTNNGYATIRSADDIESLQWARLGKKGRKLSNGIPQQFHPDSEQTDGKVDEITDLFGQVTNSGQGFAGRINPENVVFESCKSKCQTTTLAPLSPPHPGCIAFYRDNHDADRIDATKDMVRGYKVYRTSMESGAQGPWNFAVQGVYDQRRLKVPQQNVNKTVELLPVGSTGKLQIAFRALSKREFALLVQACSVPWRLGGGKPLGLGACKVTIIGVVNEFGEDKSSSWLSDWHQEVKDIADRVKMWEATQQPVPRLRYPRAVRGNSRGGHAWFQYFARPRMANDPEKLTPGLMPVYIDGELKDKAQQAGERLGNPAAIRGQQLPFFDPENPLDDLLFGYDVEGVSVDSTISCYERFQRQDDRGTPRESNVFPGVEKTSILRDQTVKKRNPETDD